VPNQFKRCDKVSPDRSISPGRFVAVDWSGRRDGGASTIWTAEVRGGRLVHLANGLTRSEVALEQTRLADDGEAVVIGFDFAFSFTEWFLAEQRIGAVEELWDETERHERWLLHCEPPFWGRPGRRRPDLGGRAHHRRTELETERRFGLRPKSVFQIGGAGAVGTGSLRGFPVLASLRRHGFAIWPFDPPGRRTVVELWPRLLTGPVRKSDPAARARYLAQATLPLSDEQLAAMEASEDAFDAGVSAFGMWQRGADLARLPGASDRVSRLEGDIWLPAR
jgi:hypothetical protein